MKVLMTGATGFIGSHLAKHLASRGHELVVLSRSPETAESKVGVPCKAHFWDALQTPAPAESFEGVEAVIHLAGEPIAIHRWSETEKHRIHESRIKGTRNLVQAISALPRPPSAFISASAIGYYGDRGSELLDENSPPGDGFLSRVCTGWEAEAKTLEQRCRVAIVRIGVVLGMGGGALNKMLPPFSKGIGGPAGDGHQWVSWVHLDDLVKLLTFVLESPEANGVWNATAPEPVPNREFSHVLGATLHRPAVLRVPALALKFALGEMAGETILASTRALPSHAEKAGFEFQYPELGPALRDILKSF